MSKHVPVGYHGYLFWVYDVCASILFAQMADVIAETPKSQRPEWLTALKQDLRVHAVLGANQHVPLDEWYDGHEEEFLALLAEAARRLAVRGRITTEEAAAWIVIDGLPIIWRLDAFEETAPAVTWLRPSLTSSTGGTPSRLRDATGSSAARRSPCRARALGVTLRSDQRLTKRTLPSGRTHVTTPTKYDT